MGILAVLLKKDFIQFSRGRIYAVLSAVGLALFIAVFWIIPDTVTESVAIGIVHHDLDAMVAMIEGEQGLELVPFADGQALEKVISGELVLWRKADGTLIELAAKDKPKDAEKMPLVAGIAFPPDFLRLAATGQAPEVQVYINDDTPQEIRSVLPAMIREISFAAAGIPLAITEPDTDSVMLGVDRYGAQISLRERMRPMLAFFVLMMETFALSSLIAMEISQKTVTAVLATPAKVWQVLLAKTIFGAFLAMFQAVVLLVAIQAFTATNWLLLLVVCLLGSLMFSSVAMLVGSWGKDFLENLFLVMIFIIPLLIPAIAVLFPGASPAWTRFIPSSGVMQVLMEVTAYGTGFAEVLPLLGISVLWTLVLITLGLMVLKRKVVRL
jgi:ABC-2 type transport system permease protein